LKELAAKEGFGDKRVHLVAHSFCGVDARAAISLYGADAAVVKSLTTVSSPHQGSRLIDNCAKYPARFQIEMAEKAFEAVGLSQGSA
jgi:triacylglycerol esterase/lipase EstA (alpha/beta hydrolase family)